MGSVTPGVPELPFRLESSDRNDLATSERLVAVAGLAHTNYPDIISFVMTIVDCSGWKKL